MQPNRAINQRIRQGVRSFLGASSLLLALVSSTAAQDLALKDATSMTGMELFLNSGAPGLVIAVVRGDETFVQGFGETAPGNGKEPDGRSIFRLGSVSKQFATDLLSAAVAEGSVKLTDPLSRYAPDGIAIKATGGRQITLLDLATHMAGLPRELPDRNAKPSDNPFLAFSKDYYWQWIGQNAPAYAPGTTIMYSNFGFGLLGEALAKAGGDSYSNLLNAKIIQPLGLTDTTTKLSEEQTGRLMTGLDPFGKADPNWPLPDIMQASAGMYSTADDMVRWMRWHLNGSEPTNAALTIDHALWRPFDGLQRIVGTEVTGAEGMGLGWVISLPKDGVPLLLGKSGGIGGFMTYVVLSPNRKLGIFVNVSRVNFAMFDNIRSSVRELAAELTP